MAQMTLWQMGIEVILVVLVAAMVSRLIQLKRIMQASSNDRLRLDTLLQDFGKSTQYAQEGLVELRNTATTIGKEVSKKIAMAKEVEKDLIDLFQLGDALATRLQDLVNSESEIERLRSEVTIASSSAMDSRPPSIRSKAEQDLLRALRASR